MLTIYKWIVTTNESYAEIDADLAPPFSQIQVYFRREFVIRDLWEASSFDLLGQKPPHQHYEYLIQCLWIRISLIAHPWTHYIFWSLQSVATNLAFGMTSIATSADEILGP